MGVNSVINKDQSTPEGAKLRGVVTLPTQVYRTTTDMNKFRSAVQAAENIFMPQRYQLLQLYKQNLLDAQVIAVMNQYKNLVMGCEFCVYRGDVEDEEKTKLIRTKWFRDFLNYVIDHEFWGHSLIQFDDIITLNGVEQFRECELVDRQYVKPEFHFMGTTTASMPPNGVFYTDPPYADWCIGVGSKRDLGLFLQITPLVIWKKNAYGAWAEFAEKFGTPLRIGKTDAHDTDSVKNMEDMLKNMGVAAWGIFRTDDIIELVETNNTDAYEVFDKMIERCNSEIAKVVLGQTMTTDNGSSRSQAEVHERILEQTGYSLKMRVLNVINDQLVPLMNNLGFKLEGCKIDIEKEDDFTIQDRAKFDLELVKTGKFTFTPEYIKENYGSDVIAVSEPTINKTNLENYKKELGDIYG